MILNRFDLIMLSQVLDQQPMNPVLGQQSQIMVQKVDNSGVITPNVMYKMLVTWGHDESGPKGPPNWLIEFSGEVFCISETPSKAVN